MSFKQNSSELRAKEAFSFLTAVSRLLRCGGRNKSGYVL